MITTAGDPVCYPAWRTRRGRLREGRDKGREVYDKRENDLRHEKVPLVKKMIFLSAEDVIRKTMTKTLKKP